MIINNFEPPAHFERLYDRVHSSKEEYKKVFYLAMGDTCVCSQIDHAWQLEGDRQFAVVTLAGEMVD